MAEPKKRTSKSRKNIRRVNHKVKKEHTKLCASCKKPIKPHTICKNCGTYNK